MTVSPSHILSFDLGTSSMKAALYHREEGLLETAERGYSITHTHEGWAEQNPDEWWLFTKELVEEILLKSSLQKNDIACLAFTAQQAGVISVDDKGKSLHPAMIWLDTRSKTEARRLVSGLFRFSGYGIDKVIPWLWLTNGAPNFSGKDPISKIKWLANHQPEIYQKARYFLDVKDYMLFKLTGQAVTSADCAHLTWMMDSRKRQWSSFLLKKVGLSEDRLPKIRSACDLVTDRISDQAAEFLGLNIETKVVVGQGDVNATAIGSGAIKDGAAHLYFGTGAWSAAHVSRRMVSPFTFIGTLCSAFQGKHLLIAAQENAGASLNKVSRMLGLENVSELDDLATQSVDGANGLLFLPWLFGERAPVDDSNILGGFLNLSPTHTQADMARAALEGVVYNQRWASEHLFRMAGTKTGSKLPVVGGVTRSDLMMQTISNIFDRPIIKLENSKYTGTLGGYICARVGLGWDKDIEASMHVVQVEKEFQPHSACKEIHEKRFIAFKDAYKATKKWYRKHGRSQFVVTSRRDGD